MDLFVIQFLLLDDLSPKSKGVITALFLTLLYKIFEYCSNHGRRKVSELFVSSKNELKYSIRNRKEEDEALYSFLSNEIEKQNLDKEWVSRFFDVCHWCGYQVLIRKDSDADLEEKTSIAYDMEIVNKLDEIEEPLFTKENIVSCKKRICKDKSNS